MYNAKLHPPRDYPSVGFRMMIGAEADYVPYSVSSTLGSGLNPVLRDEEGISADLAIPWD
jgi:hypothetical protein